MAIKKSELYSSLWKSCDELRGGMDASQYKDYVLTLLFVKYVSDKYQGKKDALIEVPAGGGFADMVRLKGDKNIGERLNTIISKLAEANELKGVIDVADFNDEDKLGKGKDMVDRLSNLIGIFENESLDFSKNNAGGDDILGDAYEYLMRHFATESGKSKGQFYTPAEVSRIMAKVVGINHATSQSNTIYDPTCGSGSLLLKAADESPKGVTIYGQENDNATAALAKMNMILHDCPTAEIWKDNTLAAPYFKNKDSTLKTFDFVVANPPFSTKAWSNGFDPANDLYSRFEYGIPPAKNGDYAFLLHIIRSLKSTGKAAVILPHGVLFRGNSEAGIRKELIKRGLIKGIIGLPANLFYGTGIPACIIVIDKETATGRSGIFMIDASKGFIKDGNKNRLRAQDIHKIVDVFSKQIEVPKFSRMVPVSEISGSANDYNLNIPRYIDSSEAEDLHDISAHLLGGIPKRDIDALSEYWDVFPSLRKDLFTPDSRNGYFKARVASADVKQAIFNHHEFSKYSAAVRKVFDGWNTQHQKALQGLKKGSNPKKIINLLAEDLLDRYSSVLLLDKYDVYQQLMNYWVATMQDDVYAISNDGWVATPDLIPANFIIHAYFEKEQDDLNKLEEKMSEYTRQLEELEEEHSGEEGLLENARTDKGKLTKASIKARLKIANDEGDADDEIAVLEKAQDILDQMAACAKTIKDTQAKLDEKVQKKYKELKETEVKDLVINKKWLTQLEHDVMNEMHRVTQALASRIKQLEERYAKPLPSIQGQITELQHRVDNHLKKMGFNWDMPKAKGAA